MVLRKNTKKKQIKLPPEGDIIKSPLNYIGGKYKILKQILPYFPSNINRFVDLFVGGGNVAVNVKAKKVILNDNLTYLIDLFNTFRNIDVENIIEHIEGRITQFNLSLTNEEGYKQVRKLYNLQKNPLDLFVLIAFSFNHQIRFNSKHEFNNPFGKERSCFNLSMKNNLEKFVKKLQSIDAEVHNCCFKEFDLGILNKGDFVYCDPPYLITTGSYNDGKRGFKGWSEKEERELLIMLDKLNTNGIQFALSNVLEHKGKKNDILMSWLRGNGNYVINYINFDYSNSNYQTKVRDKSASTEVLITNYSTSIC